MAKMQSKTTETKNPLRYSAIKEFKADPAGYLTEAINDYVRTSPLNWAAPFQHPYFRTPVSIAFGDADAPEFKAIKEKFPWTLTPREWLEVALNDPMPPMQTTPNATTTTGEPLRRVRLPMDTRPEFHPDGSVTWPDGEPPTPPWQELSVEESVKPPVALGFSRPSLEHVSVISIALPMHPKVIEDECNLEKWHFLGSPEFTYNSRVGAHGGVTQDVAHFVERLLQIFGYTTCVPYLSFGYGIKYIQEYFQYAGPTSRYTVIAYPERYWAVAAGLGTWGLNDMIITKEGIAVYITEVIVNAKLPPSPKPTQEYCLYYRNGTCGKCVEVCPVGAIYTSTPTSGEPGRLPGKCSVSADAMVAYKQKYLKDEVSKAFGDWGEGGNVSFLYSGGPSGPIGEYSSCGQCICNVPCAMQVPE